MPAARKAALGHQGNASVLKGNGIAGSSVSAWRTELARAAIRNHTTPAPPLTGLERGRRRLLPEGAGEGHLNFENLTATKYETRGSGNASVVPAHPFAIYGRIAYSFGKR